MNKNCIDKKLVKNIPMLKVACLFTELVQSSKCYKGQCPFCEDSDAFKVYPDSNRAHCFNCQWNGDAIDLVSTIKGISFQESIKWLARIFEIGKQKY